MSRSKNCCLFPALGARNANSVAISLCTMQRSLFLFQFFLMICSLNYLADVHLFSANLFSAGRCTGTSNIQDMNGSEEPFLLKIDVSQRFGWYTTKTDWCISELHMWSKDWCYHNKMFFFFFPPLLFTRQPSISIWKTKPPSFPLTLLSSFFLAVLGRTQRKVEHQGASFLYLLWICMYTPVRVALNLLFIKCLFYLSVSDVF